jgi:thioredoxin-like negative regulator of GroEL
VTDTPSTPPTPTPTPTTTTTTPAQISSPAQAANTGSTADALFATAMSELRGGNPQQARQTFHQVLMQDPHYAPAHFRMGEIALFNRNFNYAAEEMDKAMVDSDRLNPHQQQFARLSIALARHDRQEIERLDAEISLRWPDDPELARMHTTFPGMFNEIQRGGGGRRRRP